jgi:hypothetical protein
MLLRGWALVERGEKEKWFSQNYHSLIAWRSLPARGAWRTYFSALMAEVYADMGEIAEGLTVLTEALATVKGESAGGRQSCIDWKGSLRFSFKQVSNKSQAGLKQVSDKSQTSQNQSEDTDPRPQRRNRSLFPQGYRDCSAPAGEVARTARSDKPGAAATTTSNAARTIQHEPRNS